MSTDVIGGFTYHLASTDAAIATLSQIRLQIGDSVESNGPRPDGRNFDDLELSVFLTQEGNHVQRTVALALETLAAEWAKEASRQQLGPASSEANQAKAFGERAAALRTAYGFNTPTYRASSPVAASAYIDWTTFYEAGGL